MGAGARGGSGVMSDETFNVYERTATLTGNSDTGVAEAGDGRTLAGYAVKWNDVAHVFERGLEFEEQILPGSYVQPNPPKLLFEHGQSPQRSEEHTSELQSRGHLVC